MNNENRLCGEQLASVRSFGPAAIVAAIVAATVPMIAAIAPSLAQAQHPPVYYPVHRGYYRQRVVVVPPPPPVYIQPQPVRVYAPPPAPVYVPAPAPVVMQPASTWRRHDTLGVSVRVSGTGLSGHKLSLEDIENPGMWGLGLAFRSRVSPHWGIELSADYLRGQNSERGFVQQTIPVMLSALVFIFEDSAINPYGLFGVGVDFTKLSYQDGAFTHSLLEVAGALGFGVQVKFGQHFAIHADLRFLTVWNNIGNITEINNKCISAMGGNAAYCSGLNSVKSEDKFNLGAQFQAGATYYF